MTRRYGSTLFWSGAARIIASVVVVILVVSLVTYYLLPRERSTFIEARTSIARLTIAEDSDWRLPATAWCGRVRASRNEDGQVPTGQICGVAPEIAPPGAVDIRWPGGAVIELIRRGTGPLEIRVEDLPGGGPIEAIGLQGSVRVSPGVRAVMPADILQNLAAVPFAGTVEIGDRIESGANEILYEGRYQFRERLMARKSSDVVAADDLMPGDSVVIFDQNAENPMEVTGFVSPPEPGEKGFLVIASAAQKGIWPALRVGRHGFATSDIVPGWTDRALADQFTLALVAILGFGAAIMTIIVGIHDLLAGRSSTAQPRSESAVAEASPKERADPPEDLKPEG
ncbi:hypothetical protein [uncultured Jannaschia sp.]|uniref:hypothetical protein n=1 Tax=uncultured Jannaschia sp. TaxID=293347 RepID=UPI00260C5AE9|nr:hypothetical protein [uncultured Jannaschia sp.]